MSVNDRCSFVTHSNSGILKKSSGYILFLLHVKPYTRHFIMEIRQRNKDRDVCRTIYIYNANLMLYKVVNTCKHTMTLGLLPPIVGSFLYSYPTTRSSSRSRMCIYANFGASIAL